MERLITFNNGKIFFSHSLTVLKNRIFHFYALYKIEREMRKEDEIYRSIVDDPMSDGCAGDFFDSHQIKMEKLYYKKEKILNK